MYFFVKLKTGLVYLTLRKQRSQETIVFISSFVGTSSFACCDAGKRRKQYSLKKSFGKISHKKIINFFNEKAKTFLKEKTLSIPSKIMFEYLKKTKFFKIKYCLLEGILYAFFSRAYMHERAQFYASVRAGICYLLEHNFMLIRSAMRDHAAISIAF